MGMGSRSSKNEHLRIYTFSLDDRDKEQALMMKWLETQSTKVSVMEGLKLVMKGYSTVPGVSKVQENPQQSEQISQLIHLLTLSLSGQFVNSFDVQQNLPRPHQPVEEEPNEMQWENADTALEGITLEDIGI